MWENNDMTLKERVQEDAARAEAVIQDAATAVSAAARQILDGMRKGAHGAPPSFMTLMEPHWVALTFYAGLQDVLKDRLAQRKAAATGHPAMVAVRDRKALEVASDRSGMDLAAATVSQHGLTANKDKDSPERMLRRILTSLEVVIALVGLPKQETMSAIQALASLLSDEQKYWQEDKEAVEREPFKEVAMFLQKLEAVIAAMRVMAVAVYKVPNFYSVLSVALKTGTPHRSDKISDAEAEAALEVAFNEARKGAQKAWAKLAERS